MMASDTCLGHLCLEMTKAFGPCNEYCAHMRGFLKRQADEQRELAARLPLGRHVVPWRHAQ